MIRDSPSSVGMIVWWLGGYLLRRGRPGEEPLNQSISVLSDDDDNSRL